MCGFLSYSNKNPLYLHVNPNLAPDLATQTGFLSPPASPSSRLLFHVACRGQSETQTSESERDTVQSH